MLVTTALLLVSPTGTRRVAEALAERELASLLEPGETVMAQVTVAQRRAADVWRRSYGVLAATSRRLVHVGAAPLPVLRPADPGPRDLLLTSWPYDSELSLDRPSADDAGSLTVRSATRAAHFRTDDTAGALDLRRAVTDAQQRDDARAGSPPRY